MKKLKKILLNILFILVLLIGLGLVFNRSIRNFFIASQLNKNNIMSISKSSIKENKKKSSNFDFSKVKAVDFNDVMKSQISQQKFPVIGGIAIPELKINLPIFKGLDPYELAFGAGTMKPNQVMGQGNYALASHNVTGWNPDQTLLFTPLEHAETGMKIYITDKENVFEYKITEAYKVTPSHVEVLDDHPGKKEITLVTCADVEAQQRIIVRGEFVKSFRFSDSPKSVVKAFQYKYKQWTSY